MQELVSSTTSEDDLDLTDLYDPRSKYSPQLKLQVAAEYLVRGTSLQAAKATGVPSATIRSWKTRAPWWNQAIEEARKRLTQDLDAMYTAILHEGGKQILDRVQKGNIVVDAKTGEKSRAPLTARELATVTGITFDKRALQRGEPTARTEQTPAQILDQLAKKLEDVATKKLEERARTIEGEVVK